MKTGNDRIKEINTCLKKIIDSDIPDVCEIVELNTGDELGILSKNIKLLFEKFKKQNKELIANQREIYKNGEKYRLLVENLNNIIFSIDDNDNFTYLSPSFESVFKSGPDQFIGKHFLDIVHDDFKHDVKLCLESFKSNSGVEYIEFMITGNEPVWVEVQLKKVFNTEYDLNGMQGFINNITENFAAVVA